VADRHRRDRLVLPIDDVQIGAADAGADDMPTAAEVEELLCAA